MALPGNSEHGESQFFLDWLGVSSTPPSGWWCDGLVSKIALLARPCTEGSQFQQGASALSASGCWASLASSSPNPGGDTDVP